jgi:excisionase family DNA binding protein
MTNLESLIQEALSEIRNVKAVLSKNVETQYFDLKEAADFLKISLSTMQKISANRLLPVYKPGNGKVYFLKQDLINYIEAGRKKSIEEIKQEVL